MRTPKEYADNIKKGIITTSMLEAALYSVNKRAKNYRDAERKQSINMEDTANMQIHQNGRRMSSI